MGSSSNERPPMAFLVAFYGLLVLVAGMVLRAGWELMGSWIG